MFSEFFCHSFFRFGIVRQQAHYSIDVFTALYAVPLVWIAVYHFMPNDPVPAHLTAVEVKPGETTPPSQASV